jgi:hypothetical protein
MPVFVGADLGKTCIRRTATSVGFAKHTYCIPRIGQNQCIFGMISREVTIHTVLRCTYTVNANPMCTVLVLVALRVNTLLFGLLAKSHTK